MMCCFLCVCDEINWVLDEFLLIVVIWFRVGLFLFVMAYREVEIVLGVCVWL